MTGRTDRTRAALSVLDVLGQEYTALRVADFTALERLAPEKERAMQALDWQELSSGDLSALKAAALRNQSLASAVHDGITDARQDLMRLTPPDTFSAYTRDGVRQPLARR